MKKSYSVFLVLFIMLLQINIFPQAFNTEWKLNPINGNSLNDVVVVNNITAIAVGDHGTIWKTTNAGSNWSILPFAYDYNIKKIQCINDSVFYMMALDVTGNQNWILKTTNRGDSWSKQSTWASYNVDFHFFSDKTGFVSYLGYFYKTTNSGSSWSLMYGNNYTLGNINLLDSMRIYTYNTNTMYIWKTTSGGGIWTSVLAPTTLRYLQMIDSVGYAVGKNQWSIYKTTNNGTNWNLLYTDPSKPIIKVCFASKDTGYALAANDYDSSAIYRTVDGGTTWTTIQSGFFLTTMSILGKSNLYGAGLGGMIVNTVTGGTSWNIQSKIGTDFACIQFPTPFTGFIGGRGGALYKVTQGGDFYNKINFGTAKDISRILFIDSLIGFIGGSNGLLKKTTNGGSTWTNIPFDSTVYVTSLNKTTNNNGDLVLIAGDYSTKTFISNDSGNTWALKSIPNGNVYTGVGSFIGTISGTIYKYNFYTSLWEVSQQGITQSIQSISNGYNSTNYSSILAIGNNGKTSILASPFYEWQLGDATLANASGIYGGYKKNFVFGNNGNLVYSSDITNWKKEDLPTVNKINAMAMRTNGEYWVVGDNGLVNRMVEKPDFNDVKIAIDTTVAVSGDTAFVDVTLDNISGSFSSIQFEVSYPSSIRMLSIDTAGTMIGANSWICFANGNLNPGRVAAGGAKSISTTGTIARIKFFVPDTVKPKYLNINPVNMVVDNGLGVLQISHNGAIRIVKHGDVDTNGTVQAFDGALILKHLVGYITLSKAQRRVGDVSKDGTLSDVDASLIMKYITGLIDTLPAPGNYLATGSLAMNNYNANAGQLINIPVSMNQVTGLMGFEGTITFDNQKLEFMGAVASGIASNFAIEHNVTPGKILVAAASTQDAAGSGESIILQFRIKDNAVMGTTKVKIARIRLNENAEQFDVAESNINILTGINGEGSIPKEYELFQNYPNPFNPETRITFGVPEASTVTLQIFNSLGEKVATLLDEEKSAGYYNINWNAMNFSTGIYIVRITATSNESKKSFMQIKKMVLVK
jgi:photosystem II stability/assembly factor-like uncharacterized protein